MEIYDGEARGKLAANMNFNYEARRAEMRGKFRSAICTAAREGFHS
jgi:hypothetical protein